MIDNLCRAIDLFAMFAILWVLGSGDRPQLRDHVDLIELNHRFSESGVHVFDQIIFWEKAPGGKYQVRAWLMVQDDESLNRRPELIAGGLYRVTWREDNGRIHVVTSKLYRERWTDFDPEQRDLLKLPVANRYGLCKILTGEQK